MDEVAFVLVSYEKTDDDEIKMVSQNNNNDDVCNVVGDYRSDGKKEKLFLVEKIQVSSKETPEINLKMVRFRFDKKLLCSGVKPK